MSQALQSAFTKASDKLLEIDDSKTEEKAKKLKEISDSFEETQSEWEDQYKKLMFYINGVRKVANVIKHGKFNIPKSMLKYKKWIHYVYDTIYKFLRETENEES